MRRNENSPLLFILPVLILVLSTFGVVFYIIHYVKHIPVSMQAQKPSVEVTEHITEQEQEDMIEEPDAIQVEAVEEEEEIAFPVETSIVLPDEPDTPADIDTSPMPLPTIIPKQPTLGEEIFRLTNKERLDHGLNKLEYAYDLQGKADLRAQECSLRFAHTRPDGSSCHSIIHKDYYVVGENIIMADKPVAVPERLMDQWMRSTGHRANILLPDFTEMAVGVYEKNGIVYAVQLFLG